MLANDVLVDAASEVPYLRVNGRWVWGAEAESYLKAKARDEVRRPTEMSSASSSVSAKPPSL